MEKRCTGEAGFRSKSQRPVVARPPRKLTVPHTRSDKQKTVYANKGLSAGCIKNIKRINNNETNKSRLNEWEN